MMTDREIIEQAREDWAIGSNDELEIDDDAKVSRNDEGGAWVEAWVFVRTGEGEADA